VSMLQRAKDEAYDVWLRFRPVLGPIVLRGNAIGAHGYHRGRPAEVTAQAYCVYRARNADVVRAFVEQSPRGVDWHLHALDQAAPQLARWTTAAGPGARMPLLQSLIDAHPPAPGDAVILADDDVEFVGTGATRFPGLALTGGLDIAQPAHVPDSHYTYKVTEVVALSTAREVTYVEVGPFVLLGPRAWPLVLPFPPDAAMGWGVDVAWSQLRHRGLRLGVVDATPLRHLGPVGQVYDTDIEWTALQRHLRAADLPSTDSFARNTGRTWRPWQRRPRWASASEAPPPATPVA